MSDLSAKANLLVFEKPEVVSYYEAWNTLTPCERLLFDTYVRPGGAILDLGVGAGRTTRFLAARASQYVGVDYAPAMVKACLSRFPELEFVVADAADLSPFADCSLDSVIFSYNGIDSLQDQGRQACLDHIHRVLKPAGRFIFSSHNPRSIFVRPLWDHERLRRMARQYSAGSMLLYRPILATLTSARVLLACAKSAWKTLPRLFKRIPTQPFWRGEGSILDSTHGGLLCHQGTPQRTIDEMNAHHFRVERVLGEEYPQPSHPYATRWYYYVFAKS